MNILITRTKRKKTISILIKDGNVEVKAPFNLNQNEIDSFILKKEKWIKNKNLFKFLTFKHRILFRNITIK